MTDAKQQPTPRGEELKADERTLTFTKSELDYWDKCLGRMRQWIDGYQAHGGKGSSDADMLCRMQIKLHEAKP